MWNIVGRRFFLSETDIDKQSNLPHDIRIVEYNKYSDRVKYIDKDTAKPKSMSIERLFTNYNSIKPDMILSLIAVGNKEYGVNIELCISRYIDDPYMRSKILQEKYFKLKIAESLLKKNSYKSYHLGVIGDIPKVDKYVFRDPCNTHFITPVIQEYHYDHPIHKAFMNDDRILYQTHVYGYYGDSIRNLLVMIDTRELDYILKGLIETMIEKDDIDKDDDVIKSLSLSSRKISDYSIFFDKIFEISEDNHGKGIGILQDAYDIISNVYNVYKTKDEVKKLLYKIRDNQDYYLMRDILYHNINTDIDNRLMIIVDAFDLDSLYIEKFKAIDKTRRLIEDTHRTPILIKTLDTNSAYDYTDLYNNLILVSFDEKKMQEVNTSMSDNELAIFMSDKN